MDCWVNFDPPWTLTLYITTFTVLVYIIPFFALCFCYGRICVEIWMKHKYYSDTNREIYYRQRLKLSTKVSLSENSSSSIQCVPRNNSFRLFSRAKLKTVKLTSVIIIAYVLCWSPFFVSQLWWLYDENAPLTSKYDYI